MLQPSSIKSFDSPCRGFSQRHFILPNHPLVFYTRLMVEDYLSLVVHIFEKYQSYKSNIGNLSYWSFRYHTYFTKFDYTWSAKFRVIWDFGIFTTLHATLVIFFHLLKASVWVLILLHCALRNFKHCLN